MLNETSIEEEILETIINIKEGNNHDNIMFIPSKFWKRKRKSKLFCSLDKP